MENKIEQHNLDLNNLNQFNDEIKETNNEILSLNINEKIKDTFQLKTFLRDRIRGSVMKNLLSESIKKQEKKTNLSIKSNV